MSGIKVGGEEVHEGEAVEVEQEDAEAEEEGLGRALMSLESTEILTHDADPGGTTLVNARNGFNNLSRLVML